MDQGERSGELNAAAAVSCGDIPALPARPGSAVMFHIRKNYQLTSKELPRMVGSEQGKSQLLTPRISLGDPAQTRSLWAGVLYSSE